MAAKVDDAINQRIAFIKQEISPVNRPQENAALHHQVARLEMADVHNLERSVIVRRTHLRMTTDPHEKERQFCKLEALEWLH
jgi:hypothetical protein